MKVISKESVWSSIDSSPRWWSKALKTEAFMVIPRSIDVIGNKMRNFLSCLPLLFPVLSWPVLSLSCLPPSRPVLSWLVSLCLVFSYHLLACFVLSSVVISCPPLACLVFVLSFAVMSPPGLYPLLACLVFRCHFLSSSGLPVLSFAVISWPPLFCLVLFKSPLGYTQLFFVVDAVVDIVSDRIDHSGRH